eukprot:SAG11_NODE_4757_length_1778_cov_3.282311_1_plen_115_part_10
MYHYSGGQWVGVTSNPFLDTSNGKHALIVDAILDRVRNRFHIFETNIANQGTFIDLMWGVDDATVNDLFGFRDDAPTRVPYSADQTTYLGSDKVVDMNDEIHGLYLRSSLTTDGT